MRAWPAPEVPSPSGAGPALRLHDTATGQVRDTDPGPVARMYVCGITPYDATHMGHAATYVAFDLVVRVWRDLGHRVHYVQNVTDVDDPLLERAARDGEDWRALAERETETFRADMAALRVLPPDDFVGAAETVPQMVAAVQGLHGRGAAYDVDGDTYFAVHADRHFGAVSGLDEPAMLALFAERGGDPDRAGKKHPLDPVLWQTGGAAEPAWDSPLGRGRPGWHIECATIALDRLGSGFDVQGGGSDLAFPHHEMSASQAQVLTGESPFARHYVHAGMVGLGGEKMSKSRGNLVLVSSLREAGRDPMAIRLALLAHHYRSDWDWTDDDLTAAERRLQRWRDAVRRPGAPSSGPVVEAVRRHLADDLDAPGALAAVDAWADAALSGASASEGDRSDGDRSDGDAAAASELADAVDALLGVRL